VKKAPSSEKRIVTDKKGRMKERRAFSAKGGRGKRNWKKFAMLCRDTYRQLLFEETPQKKVEWRWERESDFPHENQ